MRNIFTFSALALVMILTLNACKKSDTTGTYTMSANIAGTPVSFDNSLVNVVSKPVTGTVSYIIEGLNNEAAYPYIYIYIPTNTVGTYNIGGYGSSVYAIYASDTLTTRYSMSGTVIFSGSGPTSVGSYSFTCTDGTVISSGKFTAKGIQ